MSHWCRDIQRDEAVRAAEDGRSGPLPTLEAVIERQQQACALACVKDGFARLDEAWGMIPKSVSGSSAVEPENRGNHIDTNHDAPPGARVSESPCAGHADTGADTAGNGLRTERVTDRRPKEPGGGGNVTGMRTELITPEISHDLDAPLGDWIVQVLDESLGFDEYVRVVEEAKLAPAANADGGSNHAAPQPSPGWLTAEERLALARAYDLLCDDDGDHPLARTVQRLLARSSPPEVVLEDFTPDAVRNLDTKYLAGWDQCMALAKRAISDAGVTVKEVGRE